MGDEHKGFMRAVSRCYPDGKTKPHIGYGDSGDTFKADITDESDIEKTVDAYREFLYDKFAIWQEGEYDS